MSYIIITTSDMVHMMTLLCYHGWCSWKPHFLTLENHLHTVLRSVSTERT
jgi:hypothetical protein